MSADDLHRLIYNHCYQYMRSTTPVSLFPAIYYAHLASNRARCHESNSSAEGPRGGQKFQEMREDYPGKYDNPSSSGDVAPSLLPLAMDKADGTPQAAEHVARIRNGMWYI